MAIYKIAKFIYGYLIIPLWIIFFIMTTIVLVGLTANAWISRKIFKKSHSPDFKPRTIFPYGDH